MINENSFSKSILSGLLTGIIAAVSNTIYTIVYREITGFATAEIIMPLSIFVGFPILLSMCGYAYFLMQRHLPSGLIWFIFFIIAFLIAMVLITILDT